MIKMRLVVLYLHCQEKRSADGTERTDADHEAEDGMQGVWVQSVVQSLSKRNSLRCEVRTRQNCREERMTYSKITFAITLYWLLETAINTLYRAVYS